MFIFGINISFKYLFASSISVIPSYLNSAINLSLNVLFSLSTLAFAVDTLVVCKTISNRSHTFPNCVINTFFSFSLALLAENVLLLSALIFSGIP